MRRCALQLTGDVSAEGSMSSVSILRWTIAVNCIISIYQAVLFYHGLQASLEFDKASGFVFASLLAFWVDADSRNRPEIYRPTFDIGLFVYLFWMVYLPYYLIRTRGRAGWLWIVGLAAMFFLGYLLSMAVYVAR